MENDFARIYLGSVGHCNYFNDQVIYLLIIKYINYYKNAKFLPIHHFKAPKQDQLTNED